MSVKAAILGTQHPDVTETEREILLNAGTEGFQRIAGYVPPTMPIDKLTLPLIEKPFIELSDAFIRAIGGKSMSNHKPCVVYLVLIWLLIDSSSPYRQKQYLVDDLHLRQLAAILMWIAVGGILFRRDDSHTQLSQILLKKLNANNGFESDIYGLAVSLLNAVTATELLQNAYLASITLRSTAKIRGRGLSAVMSHDMKMMLVQRIEH